MLEISSIYMSIFHAVCSIKTNLKITNIRVPVSVLLGQGLLRFLDNSKIMVPFSFLSLYFGLT